MPCNFMRVAFEHRMSVSRLSKCRSSSVDFFSTIVLFDESLGMTTRYFRLGGGEFLMPIMSAFSSSGPGSSLSVAEVFLRLLFSEAHVACSEGSLFITQLPSSKSVKTRFDLLILSLRTHLPSQSQLNLKSFKFWLVKLVLYFLYTLKLSNLVKLIVVREVGLTHTCWTDLIKKLTGPKYLKSQRPPSTDRDAWKRLLHQISS